MSSTELNQVSEFAGFVYIQDTAAPIWVGDYVCYTSALGIPHKICVAGPGDEDYYLGRLIGYTYLYHLLRAHKDITHVQYTPGSRKNVTQQKINNLCPPQVCLCPSLLKGHEPSCAFAPPPSPPPPPLWGIMRESAHDRLIREVKAGRG